MTLLSVFVTLIFLHSLVSARLDRTVVTAPIVFTAAGMVAFLFAPALPDRSEALKPFLHVAEAGLVLLLFTDASRADLQILRRASNLPVRLLSTGMLLTLALGAVGALLILPTLSLWEAGIVAAILAPTDAGLGQVIVNSPRVPKKIRQALNVEAGLNDGLSVPFLLTFIALAGGTSGHFSRFILEQLGFGAVIGAGIGLTGGWLLGAAQRRKWMAESWSQLGVVTLPLLCLLASKEASASAFIAAFVAGLAVQIGFKEAGRHSIEFAEEWGQMLNLSVFFLFGLLVARAWPQFTASHALYAVFSLTLARMVPVAVALAGTRLNRATVLFIGWFGPRGLASIVLGLIYLEELTHRADRSTIPLVVMITVLFSIFGHGLTALPGLQAYARTISFLPQEAPEFEPSDSEKVP